MLVKLKQRYEENYYNPELKGILTEYDLDCSISQVQSILPERLKEHEFANYVALHFYYCDNYLRPITKESYLPSHLFGIDKFRQINNSVVAHRDEVKEKLEIDAYLNYCESKGYVKNNPLSFYKYEEGMYYLYYND